MSKIFWFHIDMNDYRSGTHIYTFEKPPLKDDNSSDEDDDRAPEEAIPYFFNIPEKYRIYIVSEFPDYKIIDYINCDKIEECKKIYLKMFSQLYNCLPFEVTDYNYSYKDTGYYPEISEDIKNIRNMDIIDKINYENKGDNVYFVFAIDNKGKEIFTKML